MSEPNLVDINKALAAINTRNASIQEEKVEATRGPAGPRGAKGDCGAPGKNADPPKVQVGVVQVGEQAKVAVRETAPGSFVLDFVLPRAERGEVGRPGRDGVSAPTPTIEVGSVQVGDHASARVRDCHNGTFVLDLVLPQAERGSQGPPGVAPDIKVGTVDVGDSAAVFAHQTNYGETVVLDFTIPRAKDGIDGARGERGPAGLSEDDIRAIVASAVIETMQSSGVMNEHARKLIEIRAKLKKKALSADARHIGEIADMVRSVDALFDQD